MPSDDKDFHTVHYTLRNAIEQSAPPPPEFLARAIEAHLAGYPGSWKHLNSTVRTWIEQGDPATLRGVAERAMLAEDRGTVAWGAAQLLGPCYDPTRDPPRPELIRTLYADPRYQPLLFEYSNLLRAALPLARADLRAGRLDWNRADLTLEAIDRMYGGLRDSAPMFHARRRSRELAQAEWEEAQRERREAVADFLTPEDPQGPPTDGEWIAYRAARARESFESRREWHRVLEAMPPGPWEASDRALLDEALARLRAGVDELALPVGWALAGKPSLEDLPVLEELVAQYPDDGRMMVDALRAARVTLGLPAIEGEDEDEEDGDGAATEDEDEGEGEDDASGEWMDEPDDDG